MISRWSQVRLRHRIVAALDVAVVGGQVERRPAALVGEVHVRAALDQQRRQRVVPVVDRRQQRRPAVLGGLIDVGAGVEQRRADSMSPSRAAKTSAVSPPPPVPTSPATTTSLVVVAGRRAAGAPRCGPPPLPLDARTRVAARRSGLPLPRACAAPAPPRHLDVDAVRHVVARQARRAGLAPRIGSAASSALTASGCCCSAAHISAVVPRRFSRGVDVGARARRGA